MKFCRVCLIETERYNYGECKPCCYRRTTAYRASPHGAAMKKAWTSRPEYIAAERERTRRARNLPDATRPCPELCEWPECERKATTLDHCHKTGIFRGWLCNAHNRGLGLIGDTKSAMLAGLKYLEAVK